MKIRGRKLASRMITWVLAEIILTCIGTDTLADYSEFVFDKEVVTHLS